MKQYLDNRKEEYPDELSINSKVDFSNMLGLKIVSSHEPFLWKQLEDLFSQIGEKNQRKSTEC